MTGFTRRALPGSSSHPVLCDRSAVLDVLLFRGLSSGRSDVTSGRSFSESLLWSHCDFSVREVKVRRGEGRGAQTRKVRRLREGRKEGVETYEGKTGEGIGDGKVSRVISNQGSSPRT
uniref:Uncharacterized protein n=1 Tax=Kwoniella bestiolae CBS 10118 TaxID=1296100 RepID=A0A1B9GBC7_9TREE|nr:hypothetical protein I302_03180 [Kwoniella bestiolae CBS 10118]OCF28324.1 hypothetical protein I302_03180 [Kwoniella bestiolae CBS 10118]